MKQVAYISVFLLLVLIAASGTSSLIIPTHEPIPMVLEKTATHDVVFFGTTHQRPRILNFISTLIPQLYKTGITHIGLEIASDQQDQLNRFMKTGNGLSKIEIFPGIDCLEYRSLLNTIRNSPLIPVALDLPKSMWRKKQTRDQWMADRISETLSRTQGTKLLVVVGNLHTLKQVHWRIPKIKDQFIRHYLSRKNPALRLYSISASIDESVSVCDFQKQFGNRSSPVCIETRLFNRKLGLTQTLAVKPMSAHEAVDAVIVF